MGSSPVPVGVTVSWDGPGTWPVVRGLAVTLSSRCVPQLQNLVPLQPCPVGAPWGSTTAGGLSGSAGADRSVTPFLLRTGTSPSLSRRSIRTVIFSCRYFPQANFSVTFHPFLSVSGCYFLPWRCLPSQIPAAPPALPAPGMAQGLGQENRQGWLCWAPREGFWEPLPTPPRGRGAGVGREELEIPWQRQRAGLGFAPAAPWPGRGTGRKVGG